MMITKLSPSHVMSRSFQQFATVHVLSVVGNTPIVYTACVTEKNNSAFMLISEVPLNITMFNVWGDPG